MRALALIHAVLAAGWMVAALVALFGIGITGLILMGVAVVFAVASSLAQTGSRLGVVLSLAVLVAQAVLAIQRLAASPVGTPLKDQALLAGAIALAVLASVAVCRDWRALRRAPWF